MHRWRVRPVSRPSLVVVGLAVVLLSSAGWWAGSTAPAGHASAARPGRVSGFSENVDTITTLGKWVDLTSSAGTPPGGRQDYAMAYDPLLNAVVLFGGIDTEGGALGDTWEYTEAGWTNLTPHLSASPAARWAPSLTYDPALGALLLFGGQFAVGAENAYNDTWEFNASGWTELHPANSPPPEGVQLVYDAADGYAFAWGIAGTERFQNDWAFENGDWTNLTGSITGAPPTFTFYAAYDPQRNYVLFYGGISAFCVGGLTYAYSDGVFRNLTSTEAQSPYPIIGSGVLTYDPAADGMILFSGYDTGCGITNATWEFQNGQWANVTSTAGTPPPGRWDARLAYDPSVGGAVTVSGNENLVAGENNFGTDTWVYRVPLGVDVTASPASGESPLTVTFNATAGGGAPAYDYRWSFGDGTSNATEANVTHVYQRPGFFAVTLTVTDQLGDVATAALEVVVQAPALAVDASVSPTEGVAPLQVTFNVSVPEADGPYEFHWDFGDGTPNATTANGTHTFEQVGSYTVTLSVEDALGSFANTSFLVGATATPVKTPVNTTNTGLELGIVIGLVVGAVIAGGMVWVVVRRRPPPSPPPPAQSP